MCERACPKGSFICCLVSAIYQLRVRLLLPRRQETDVPDQNMPQSRCMRHMHTSWHTPLTLHCIAIAVPQVHLPIYSCVCQRPYALPGDVCHRRIVPV
jgi:hypothetical protein